MFSTFPCVVSLVYVLTYVAGSKVHVVLYALLSFFFFQAEDGIRDAQESRGLGDVYKRQSMYSTVRPRRSILVVTVPAGSVAVVERGFE